MAALFGLVSVAMCLCLLMQPSAINALEQHVIEDFMTSTASTSEHRDASTSGGDLTVLEGCTTGSGTNNCTEKTTIANISDRKLTATWLELATTSHIHDMVVTAAFVHGVKTGNNTYVTTSADTPEVTSLAAIVQDNDATGSGEPTGSDGVGPVVKSVEVALSVFGFLVNALTCVTLARHGSVFCRFTLLLLQHQSLIDGYLCVAAMVLFLQPAMWWTGVRWIDWVVCHFWHTQFFYWTYSLVSAWNIVFMAVDRCVAVCLPMRHKCVSSRHVIGAFIAMHAAAFGSCVPPLFMVSVSADGTCERISSLPPEIAEKLYYGYAIFYLLVAYLLPVAAFTALYGHVLVKIRRRMRPISLGAANCLSIMTLRVTKCAVAVTAIFVLTVGYDVIYFFVSSMGVTEYEFDSPLQLAGIFLNLCNSVANPIVYVILLPSFRASVRRTFRCSTTEATESTVCMSEDRI